MIRPRRKGTGGGVGWGGGRLRYAVSSGLASASPERWKHMGIWDRLKQELIDIIEWLDDTHDTMVFRFERFQNEIKYGAKLIVREGQAACFINEGKLADVFGPGTYTLTTQNLPILATLKGWKYGF